MKLSGSLLGAVGAAAGTWALARLVAERLRWFSYAGRVAVINGGSRGLGLVLARQLVDRGVRVALFARTPADVAAAVRELTDRGGDVFGIPCDVRDAEQVEAFVRQVVDCWGTVDLLFNVAGVIQVGPQDAMTEDDFRSAMETNCWGPPHTIRAVLPVMRRRQWGRIVNVASIGGKCAVPHLLPYDTSKFALVGLSTGLRTELAGEGILVTTACPTLMRTGSPRNAVFKGRHRQEYAWFSIGGALPFLSISAERAADQILRACQRGAGEIYVTSVANLPVRAVQLLPSVTKAALTFANPWLPSMGGRGRSAAFGYESESWASPSWLTRLGDQAAVRNNQLRPRRESASTSAPSPLP